MTRSWWRENRYWLPALPVALAAMMLTSSYNVKDYWYDNGLHHKLASAPQRTFVSTTDHYDDAIGPTSRTYSVRLAGLGSTDAYPDEEDGEPGSPPDGVDAVVVQLDWKAPVDQVLRGCTVSLVDDQGLRYDVDSASFVNVCTPDGHAGPHDPFSVTDQRGLVPEGEDRPTTWSTSPVVLVPHGRTVTQVLVWWQTPNYVQLSAS
jgi:hypothetical protein